jgi:isocitrate dehydrogenase kinase/phosphatase
MFLRRISQSDVQAIVAYGEVIDQRPNDAPFPSYLLLGFVAGRPIHVVFSYDESTDTGYVVTAYIPDPRIWQDDFKTRK